jgi:hypothetical protein
LLLYLPIAIGMSYGTPLFWCDKSKHFFKFTKKLIILI